MHNCAVDGCQYQGTHRFPKDETRKIQWLSVIKHPNDNFKITKHSRICSTHFRENDFSMTPSFWHNYHTARNVLKKTAIPSVFPWNKHIIAFHKQQPSTTQVQDALRFDHTKLKATYTRNRPIAFAEEQPFMVTEAADLIKDPLECKEPESIPDDINSVVKCEFDIANEDEEQPKRQQHDKSVQTIDVQFNDS